MHINSKNIDHYTILEGGYARWKLYWSPVVNGAAEPQEGGGIARAWIADPKENPGIGLPMPE